jgi:hypothetical protein
MRHAPILLGLIGARGEHRDQRAGARDKLCRRDWLYVLDYASDHVLDHVLFDHILGRRHGVSAATIQGNSGHDNSGLRQNSCWLAMRAPSAKA